MPCSESLLEEEVKVLCHPQEQLLGLGVLGPSWLMSAGWLEKEPWNVLWWVLSLAHGSERDLFPLLSSRGQDGPRAGSCN